jgi:hypothetical protein
MRKDNAELKPREGSKTVKQRMEKVREGKIAARHERLLAKVQKQHNRRMGCGPDGNELRI